MSWIDVEQFKLTNLASNGKGVEACRLFSPNPRHCFSIRQSIDLHLTLMLENNNTVPWLWIVFWNQSILQAIQLDVWVGY